MEQSKTRKQFFLFFFIALFILVARLFYPFLTIILWSGLLYAFLEPLYERLTANRGKNVNRLEKSNFKRTFIAGMLAFLGVVLILIPLLYLSIILIRQTLDLLGSVVRAVEAHPDTFSLSLTSPVGGFINRVSGGSIDLSHIDVIHEVKAFFISSSRSIIGFSGTLLKNIFGFLITLAFMIFTLFFLLLDGKHLISVIVSAMPIEHSYTTIFMQKMRETSKQLVKGFVLVALYQAFAMFVITLAFGFNNSLVLAALTAIASFVPMVGAALVWVPLTVFMAISGPMGRAILFLVLSSFFVSVMDNFIRPLVLGERLRIHPLLIFFAIVGGLELFGFNGLILGPLILMVFFSAVELFDKQVLPETDQKENRNEESLDTKSS
jgi:predicted PurR-regulated permease PerM